MTMAQNPTEPARDAESARNAGQSPGNERPPAPVADARGQQPAAPAPLTTTPDSAVLLKWLRDMMLIREF